MKEKVNPERQEENERMWCLRSSEKSVSASRE